jgi:hypothetical protein
MPSHAHIPGCARLNVGRLNAFRLNYAEPITFVGIGGIDRSRNVRIEGAAVQHVLNDAPDTAGVRVHGFAPRAGEVFNLYTGDQTPDRQLFGGRILENTVLYESIKQNVAYDVQAIDHTWLLNRRRVLARYVNAYPSQIVTSILQGFAPGVTGNHIAFISTIIDAITFTNETVAACITAVCERVGAYWYLDYQNDLHLYLTEAPDANPITDANPRGASAITLTEDLSQVVTRVIARGAGAGAAVDLAAGATELPIDLGDQANFYQTGGGVAEVAAQRLTYTGVRGLGAVGALVGSGNAPSTAPVVTQAGGGGSSLIAGGVYQYAVTFVTASGETLPGPLGSGAPSGAAVPNPVQAYAQDGSYGPSGGDINQPVVGGSYQFRYVLPYDGGSYGVGAASAAVIYHGKYWQHHFGYTAMTPDGIVYFPELQPGYPNFTPPTGRYRQIWIYRTVNGGSTFYGCGHYDMPTQAGSAPSAAPGGVGWWTNPILWSDADTIGGAGGGALPAVGPPFTALYLSQLPKSTLPAVTSRKLYRTATNGAQLKLLATLNTTDTAYVDIKADATLGANAPTTDASAIPSDTAQQVPAGSTSLPVSATGPFETDGAAGWARVGNIVIRYTGIGTGTLIGLPATGPGALSATVRYGSQVLVQPRLVGVAGLLYDLRKGESVALRVEVDDPAAQDAFAARLGSGQRADGVVEEVFSDSRMTIAELLDYAAALLADRKDPRLTLRFVTRDPSVQVGRLIGIDIATPPISGNYRIQRIAFDEIAITGGLSRTEPRRTVEASNKLYTFADLLRRLRGREGGAS